MYRLLALAKYEDRYVIPNGATSDAHRLDAIATGCSLDGDGGPGMNDGVGMTAFDVMAEKFHLLDDTNGAAPENKSGRVNLLNWDGRSMRGLLPQKDPAATNGAHANGAHAAPEPAPERVP
jgi:nitrate reductase beta subunit